MALPLPGAIMGRKRLVAPRLSDMCGILLARQPLGHVRDNPGHCGDGCGSA